MALPLFSRSAYYLTILSRHTMENKNIIRVRFLFILFEFRPLEGERFSDFRYRLRSLNANVTTTTSEGGFVINANTACVAAAFFVRDVARARFKAEECMRKIGKARLDAEPRARVCNSHSPELFPHMLRHEKLTIQTDKS